MFSVTTQTPVACVIYSHRVLSRQIYLRKYLAADTAEIQTAEQSGYRTTSSKVIVIGGSGRVGGSTVRALRQLAGPDVELLVGGRSEENFLKSIEVCVPDNMGAMGKRLWILTRRHVRGS